MGWGPPRPPSGTHPAPPPDKGADATGGCWGVQGTWTHSNTFVASSGRGGEWPNMGAEVPRAGEGHCGTIHPLLAWGWGGDKGPFGAMLRALHRLL